MASKNRLLPIALPVSGPLGGLFDNLAKYFPTTINLNWIFEADSPKEPSVIKPLDGEIEFVISKHLDSRVDQNSLSKDFLFLFERLEGVVREYRLPLTKFYQSFRRNVSEIFKEGLGSGNLFNYLSFLTWNTKTTGRLNEAFGKDDERFGLFLNLLRKSESGEEISVIEIHRVIRALLDKKARLVEGGKGLLVSRQGRVDYRYAVIGEELIEAVIKKGETLSEELLREKVSPEIIGLFRIAEEYSSRVLGLRSILENGGFSHQRVYRVKLSPTHFLMVLSKKGISVGVRGGNVIEGRYYFSLFVSAEVERIIPVVWLMGLEQIETLEAGLFAKKEGETEKLLSWSDSVNGEIEILCFRDDLVDMRLLNEPKERKVSDNGGVNFEVLKGKSHQHAYISSVSMDEALGSSQSGVMGLDRLVSDLVYSTLLGASGSNVVEGVRSLVSEQPNLRPFSVCLSYSGSSLEASLEDILFSKAGGLVSGSRLGCVLNDFVLSNIGKIERALFSMSKVFPSLDDLGDEEKYRYSWDYQSLLLNHYLMRKAGCIVLNLLSSNGLPFKEWADEVANAQYHFEYLKDLPPFVESSIGVISSLSEPYITRNGDETFGYIIRHEKESGAVLEFSVSLKRGEDTHPLESSLELSSFKVALTSRLYGPIKFLLYAIR